MKNLLRAVYCILHNNEFIIVHIVAKFFPTYKLKLFVKSYTRIGAPYKAAWYILNISMQGNFIKHDIYILFRTYILGGNTSHFMYAASMSPVRLLYGVVTRKMKKKFRCSFHTMWAQVCANSTIWIPTFLDSAKLTSRNIYCRNLQPRFKVKM